MIDHIESRKSKNRPGSYEFIAVITRPIEEDLAEAITELNTITVGPVEQHTLSLFEQGYATTNLLRDAEQSRYLPGFPGVPWFPQTLQELISHLGKTLQCGSELQADHPVGQIFISGKRPKQASYSARLVP